MVDRHGEKERKETDGETRARETRRSEERNRGRYRERMTVGWGHENGELERHG